jgi:hypothetical protein
MDLTTIVVALAAWCMISIPAGILIGTLMAPRVDAPVDDVEIEWAIDYPIEVHIKKAA